MLIKIGSKNRPKVGAVEEAIINYSSIEDPKFISVSAPSDVSEQPTSFDETIQGAINRAKNAFGDCDLSVGIEDGLMEVKYVRSGYMNFAVCAIYDGDGVYLGFSPAFEHPFKPAKLIFGEKLDLNQAYLKAGLTDNPNLGAAEGVLGLLSNKKITRQEYTKYGVIMALINWEFKD